MQSCVGRALGRRSFYKSFTGMKLQVESLLVSSWLLVALTALGFLDLQLCGSNLPLSPHGYLSVYLCLHMAVHFL